MNWLINTVCKISGLSWVWAKLDGAKIYITGTLTILTGLIGLLQGYLGATEAHNFATLWAFIQTLPKDANWMMVLAGFGIIAGGHKIDKNTASVLAVGPAPIPNAFNGSCGAIKPFRENGYGH